MNNMNLREIITYIIERYKDDLNQPMSIDYPKLITDEILSLPLDIQVGGERCKRCMGLDEDCPECEGSGDVTRPLTLGELVEKGPELCKFKDIQGLWCRAKALTLP